MIHLHPVSSRRAQAQQLPAFRRRRRPLPSSGWSLLLRRQQQQLRRRPADNRSDGGTQVFGAPDRNEQIDARSLAVCPPARSRYRLCRCRCSSRFCFCFSPCGECRPHDRGGGGTSGEEKAGTYGDIFH